MQEAGVAYAAAMVVSPTREMRQRYLRERGDYGTTVWESNSGLALDYKLLRRLDHNNAWDAGLVNSTRNSSRSSWSTRA